MTNNTPPKHETCGCKESRSRRDFLINILTSSTFIAANTFGFLKPAQATPKKMPAGKSIYTLEGQVWINKQTANHNTMVKPTDQITTGNDGRIIFAVGKDAFILKSNSQLQLKGDNKLINSMRLITGKLLSAFGKRSPHEQKNFIYTPTATIGIRGTGIYLESDKDKTYFCTCYGKTDIFSPDGKSNKSSIQSTHHSARYIYDENTDKSMTPAPMINHEDSELALIEALLGRKPPF